MKIFCKTCGKFMYIEEVIMIDVHCENCGAFIRQRIPDKRCDDCTGKGGKDHECEGKVVVEGFCWECREAKGEIEVGKG